MQSGYLIHCAKLGKQKTIYLIPISKNDIHLLLPIYIKNMPGHSFV
jgi:hypothetical protein